MVQAQVELLVNTDNGSIVAKYVKPYTHGTIERSLNGTKLPQSFSYKIVMTIWKF